MVRLCALHSWLLACRNGKNFAEIAPQSLVNMTVALPLHVTEGR